MLWHQDTAIAEIGMVLCSIDLVCEPAFGCFLSPMTWTWRSADTQQPEPGPVQDETCLCSLGCTIQTAEACAGHDGTMQSQHDQQDCLVGADAEGTQTALRARLQGSSGADEEALANTDVLVRIKFVQQLAHALDQLIERR